MAGIDRLFRRTGARLIDQSYRPQSIACRYGVGQPRKMREIFRVHHERVGGRRHGPSPQRFALQERAQHGAFDRDAPTIHRQHFDEVVVRAEDLDDERRVAAAFHAEARTPELRFGERSAKLSQPVEAAPRVGRQQNPRRAAARVEGQMLGTDSPRDSPRGGLVYRRLNERVARARITGGTSCDDQ